MEIRSIHPSWQRPLALIWTASALLATLHSVAFAAFSPGVFEVDVIFPRNDTYNITAYLPIVFAVQNLNLAVPLNAYVAWTLIPPTPLSEYTPYQQGTFDLSQNDAANSSHPYLATNFPPFFNNSGTWALNWRVQANNCSILLQQNGYGFDYGGTIHFTASPQGKQPNFTAASGKDQCVKTPGFAVNVTAIDGTTPDDQYPNGVCAVLATNPTPAINPCAVSVSSAQAANISASAVASICNEIMLAMELNMTCPKLSDGARLGMHAVWSTTSILMFLCLGLGIVWGL